MASAASSRQQGADSGFWNGAQVKRLRREHRGATGAEGVDLGRGFLLIRCGMWGGALRIFFNFLAGNGAS